MGPRKRKRQSVSAWPSTKEANGGEADRRDDRPTEQQQQQHDGDLVIDISAAQPSSDASEAQPDITSEQHQSHLPVKVKEGERAQSDEPQPQQQPVEHEADNGGEVDGADEEHDESEHDRDADDDAEEQHQEAEAEQPVEETGGRTRPMRAVRQKAEEEAAAKKRRRKNRKRRRDGTYMASDEEDEEDDTEPKQRRARRSNAARHDDSDDDDGDREPHKTVQWVQCELCSKWRKAPAKIDTGSLPDQWHCALNTWDAAHASCEAAEEVQQDEETIWPGLPRHFLNSREREDFYFSITRPPFDSAHAPPYPTVQSQPIDLYMLYAHVLTHQPYQTTLEYWAPLAEQLELRPTEKCWKLLRRAYRRYVKAKVLSERDAEAADERDDEADGPMLIGASESEAKKKRVYWTEEEDAHLRQAIEQYGTGKWTQISAHVKELGRHSSQEIRNRWRGYTRNRKVKLRVVSDEKLKEMEESDGGHASARSAEGAAPLAAGKRPFPVNVMEMDEHMRYTAVGRKHRTAAVSVEDIEVKQQEAEVKEPILAEAIEKPVPSEVIDEAAEVVAETIEKPAGGQVDKVKTVESEEQPLQQFYRKHRHVSVRLSPTVTLPLPSLRRYLCDVVGMKADSVLRLLKDMWDESEDEDEKRRLLSEAVYAQMLSDNKRAALVSEMDQYCTQTLRKDRRVRWTNQLAAYQQSLQAAAAAAAAAELSAAAESASDSAAPSPSPALESTSAPAALTLTPLQLATPVRKRYKLPTAAFGSPVTAATPVDATQAGGAVQMALPVVPLAPVAVVPPTPPVRPRTYTLPAVANFFPTQIAAVGPAVETPAAALNPSPAFDVAVDVSPLHVDSRSPAALAARIQRPPPLPPNLSSPSSVASPNSLTSPPTSASNRRGNQQRGPYFTSRKRVALSAARDAMQALIRTGTLTPAPGHTQYIDDRPEWTDYDRAIAEAVAPGNVEDFTPAGVKLSAMLRLVDDRVLEDQKKRSERRHHVQAARVRDVGSEDTHDGEEDEEEAASRQPTANAVVTTDEEQHEQKSKMVVTD